MYVEGAELNHCGMCADGIRAVSMGWAWISFWIEFNNIRQDPLEAILVIFGRRTLFFFLFESSWENMKNDTTFVRMRSGDHFGDAKMSKKGTSLRRI